ncbi:hypothetical protein RI367_003802 [Sorochytrium milnesiophthora]
MPTSVLILALVLLQVAALQVDFNKTVEVASKPFERSANVTVSARWDAVNNTRPDYNSFAMLIATDPELNKAVTHQLIVTTVRATFFANVTIVNSTVYGSVRMARVDGVERVVQVEPVNPKSIEGVTMKYTIYPPTGSRQHYRITPTLTTDLESVARFRSFRFEYGDVTEIRTVHEMAGTHFESTRLGVDLTAYVFRDSRRIGTRKQPMLLTTVDVEPYLAPAAAATKYSLYASSLFALPGNWSLIGVRVNVLHHHPPTNATISYQSQGPYITAGVQMGAPSLVTCQYRNESVLNPPHRVAVNVADLGVSEADLVTGGVNLELVRSKGQWPEVITMYASKPGNATTKHKICDVTDIISWDVEGTATTRVNVRPFTLGDYQVVSYTSYPESHIQFPKDRSWLASDPHFVPESAQPIYATYKGDLFQMQFGNKTATH